MTDPLTSPQIYSQGWNTSTRPATSPQTGNSEKQVDAHRDMTTMRSNEEIKRYSNSMQI